MFSQVKHKRTENCFSRCYCWDSSVLSCFWGKKLHRWFLFCFLSIRNTSISMSIFTYFGVQVRFIIFRASICLQMAVHSECGYSVLGKMGRRARLILCLSGSGSLCFSGSVSLSLFYTPTHSHTHLFTSSTNHIVISQPPVCGGNPAVWAIFPPRLYLTTSKLIWKQDLMALALQFGCSWVSWGC